MNGFTERRASGASDHPDAGDRVLTWDTSSAMLPLVGRIAQDMVQFHQRLARIQPEKGRLDRHRQDLSWPERARRYQLDEEMVGLVKELGRLEEELNRLGVIVLDGTTGLMGFPTIVNDRRAFFSWKPGEEVVAYWNFADDTLRRKVPESWTKGPLERPQRGKARK